MQLIVNVKKRLCVVRQCIKCKIVHRRAKENKVLKFCAEKINKKLNITKKKKKKISEKNKSFSLKAKEKKQNRKAQENEAEHNLVLFIVYVK